MLNLMLILQAPKIIQNYVQCTEQGSIDWCFGFTLFWGPPWVQKRGRERLIIGCQMIHEL